MSKVWILALMFLSAAVHAAHFDEVGGLTGIPHDGTYLPILGGFIVESETGEGLYLAGSKKLRLKRKGDTWRGTLELPAGVIRFEAAWTDLPGKLRFEGSLRASGKKAVSNGRRRLRILVASRAIRGRAASSRAAGGWQRRSAAVDAAGR